MDSIILPKHRAEKEKDAKQQQESPSPSPPPPFSSTPSTPEVSLDLVVLLAALDGDKTSRPSVANTESASVISRISQISQKTPSPLKSIAESCDLTDIKKGLVRRLSSCGASSVNDEVLDVQIPDLECGLNQKETHDTPKEQAEVARRVSYEFSGEDAGDRIVNIAKKQVNEDDELNEIEDLLREQALNLDDSLEKEGDDQSPIPWWKRRHTCIVLLVCIVLIVSIALGVSLGQSRSTEVGKSDAGPPADSSLSSEIPPIMQSTSPSSSSSISYTPSSSPSTLKPSSSSSSQPSQTAATLEPDPTQSPTSSPVTSNPTQSPSKSPVTLKPSESPTSAPLEIKSPTSLPSNTVIVTTNTPVPSPSLTSQTISSPTYTPSMSPTVNCDSYTKKKECLRPRKQMCDWDPYEGVCSDGEADPSKRKMEYPWKQ